jgi:hypothetical protein
MPLGTVSRRRGAPARPPEDWSIFLLLQKEGGRCILPLRQRTLLSPRAAAKTSASRAPHYSSTPIGFCFVYIRNIPN